jgi:hypothetical protein
VISNTINNMILYYIKKELRNIKLQTLTNEHIDDKFTTK